MKYDVPDFLKRDRPRVKISREMKALYDVYEEYEKHFGKLDINTWDKDPEETIKELKDCIKKNKTWTELYDYFKGKYNGILL